MKTNVLRLCIASALIATTSAAGERPKGPDRYAITGARIVTGSGQVIEQGTLVLEHGLITAVGASVEVPDGVWVIDGSGKVVYPGLVDALSDIALEKSEASGDAPFSRGPLDRPGTTSWAAAADALVLDDDRVEAWRNAGFTSTVSSPSTGIVSGQAAFLNLAGERDEDLVVATPVALRVNFEPNANRSFPGSLMGVLAYIRQVFADASHYRVSQTAYAREPRGKRRPRYDRALAPLAEAQVDGWPVLMPGHWEHEIERAVRLGREIGVRPVVYGLHEGHRAAEFLASENVAVLVSLKWPEADEDRDPEAEEPLRVLRMREQAPKTPAALAKAGVMFGFYSDGLESPKEIFASLRKAIDRGLTHESALHALTLGPATIFGVDDRLGSLEAGKIANVIVADGALFDEDTRIETVFVDGAKYEIRKSTDEGGSP